MLRYIHADQLNDLLRLAEMMFQDRAAQFHTRLSSDVRVDETGAERDEYDDLNPLCIIWKKTNKTLKTIHTFILIALPIETQSKHGYGRSQSAILVDPC